MAKGKELELSIRIAGQVDKSLIRSISQTQRNISGFSKNISRIGTAGLAAMGALTAGATVAINSCRKLAAEYENNLGDVVKYVDGLADAQGRVGKAAVDANGKLAKAYNGKTYAENYDRVYKNILNISTQVPLTSKYLTELTAIIGQSGKSIEEMFTYDAKGNVIGGLVKDAGVMAAAWDIGAKEAADYSAKWENSFKMNHEEVMHLANQINYLGANSATTAAEIANAVNAAGSVGQLAGIDVSTTAALADAMLATGVASDSVGTSIKRMALNLSRGEYMTKKQKMVLEELGMTAKGVTKGLQEDSVGTLQAIFDGINNLPEENRLNAVGQLFGIWAAEGGAKIANNMDVYLKALDMLDDPEVANSMQREFNVKNATPEAVRMMRDNAFQMMQINFGKAFVPLQKQVDNSLRNLFIHLNDDMPQLEQLSGTLAELASKGIDKIADAVDRALPYVQDMLDYLLNNGPQVKKLFGGAAAGFLGMKFAPQIEGAFRGAGGLLFGNKSGGKSSRGLLNAVTMPGMKEAIFGRRLKNGSTRGGLINHATDMLAQGKTGIGNARDYGLGIWNAAKGLGNTKIGRGIAGGMMKTGGVTKEIITGIYGATFKDLVDGAGTLGGMAIGGVQSKAGLALNALGNSKAGMLAKTAAGSIGGLAGKAGGVIGGMLPSLGQFGGAAMNLGGAIASPMSGILSGAGGLMMSALPITAAITGTIAVVSILGDNLEGIRTIIGNVFGEQGLAIFDAFTDKIGGIGDFISGLFKEGGVEKALSGAKGGFMNLFGGSEASGAAFDGFITVLQSVMGVVQTLVQLGTGPVKNMLLNIFGYIQQTVMPIIFNTFAAAAPFIATIIQNIGSAIRVVIEIIMQLMPIIQTVITVVLNVASAVIPILLAGFAAITTGIVDIIENIKRILTGVISFVTGVFTGDWKKAWNGIKDIFGGIFGALTGLVKTPLNAIIGMINGAIDRANRLKGKIPLVGNLFGGKDIPHVAKFAEGGFTNGLSIAGEAGTEAVISFQNGVRRKNLAIWEKAGQMLGVKKHNIADIGEAPNSGSQNIVFSPQINITGNADREDISESLRVAYEEFKSMMNRYKKEQRRYGFST